MKFLPERAITADDFKKAKITENMLVFCGVHTADRFLAGCKTLCHETVHQINPMALAVRLAGRNL